MILKRGPVKKREIRLDKRDGESIQRRSKDKKLNAECRVLLDRIGELGWTILNSDIRGDEMKE